MNLIHSLRRRLEGPPMPDPAHRVPSDQELAEERDRRVSDIVSMQAEGSVLLSAGLVDYRNFSLFDEQDSESEKTGA